MVTIKMFRLILSEDTRVSGWWRLYLTSDVSQLIFQSSI